MENSFYQLTPDRVLDALEKSGLEPSGHCFALNSYENRVYDLRLDSGEHVVAKFYRPGRWSKEEILAEHNFLFELQKEEIPVCAPALFPDGTSLQKIDNIFYAIWPRTGGRSVDEFTDENLREVGRLCARIHSVGKIKNEINRPRLTSQYYGLDSLNFLLENNFLPSNLEERYSLAVREIAKLYDAEVARMPFQRIHGDCHLGNLLYGNEGWFFLDFDDFLTGPVVQDIWMLVPARDAEGLRQREIFLEGYTLFADFKHSWFDAVELLRALRYTRYAAWLARRWEDPAFPKAFPYFGSQDYWQTQVNDLEDQLDFYYHHSKPQNIFSSSSLTEEPELTNKDFFWDLED